MPARNAGGPNEENLTLFGVRVRSEIQEMELSDAADTNGGSYYLAEQEEQIGAQEDEFELYLLTKGVISNIPTRDETDEEFDKFEPIEVEGEPLSETIIRERR